MGEVSKLSNSTANVVMSSPKPTPNLPATVHASAAPVSGIGTAKTIRYVDATQLKSLMACPAQFKMRHIEGWAPPEDEASTTDLWFGAAFGAGLEAYWKGILENGHDCDTALRGAIRVVLQAGWDDVAGIPRHGRYETVWRCLGLEKYKNEAGRPAKCPFSHKGKFFPTPSPETCSCGSATAVSRRWFPQSAAKDRIQLVRALVWYTEEVKTQSLRPISMGTTDESGQESHQALVEVPFRLPFAVIAGTQYVLVGWWDALMQVGTDGPVWVVDYKTSKNTLSGDYFSHFQPNVQVDTYDMVAKVMLPTAEGVGIYAMQVGAGRDGEGWVRFAFRPFVRSDHQRAEFAREIHSYLVEAAIAEKTGYYRMNRTSCRFCEFKAVCNSPAAARQHVLEQNYVRRRWNPLTRTVDDVQPACDTTPHLQTQTGGLFSPTTTEMHDGKDDPQEGQGLHRPNQAG